MIIDRSSRTEYTTTADTMLHIGNTMKMCRIVENITVYERNQQLEKEVMRLKKELSKRYLTKGRDKWRRYGYD